MVTRLPYKDKSHAIPLQLHLGTTNTVSTIRCPSNYPRWVSVADVPSLTFSLSRRAAVHRSSVARHGLALAVLLVFQFALLLWQAWNIGVTVDEPAHLVSSYLYWRGQDFLLPRDMPPLIKITSGWVPSPELMKSVPSPQPGSHQWEWNAGLDLMNSLPPASLDELFFWSRLPFLVYPLATTTLVFFWGRELLGPTAALIAATLFAAEPTSLGHGAVIKNDHAAAFCYLLFWFAAWRYWRRPSATTLAVLAIATALSVLAKNSLAITVLIAPMLILLRACTPWRRPAMRSIFQAILPIVFTYAVTLATCWFDISRLTAREYVRLVSDPALPAALDWIFTLARYLPMPRPFLDGVVSLFRSNANGNPVYLLGQLHPDGSRVYFLTALAVKVPHALQMLLLGAAAILSLQFLRRPGLRTDLVFLVFPPLLYITLSSLASLQFGIRLILPALPFGVLLGASLWDHAPAFRLPVLALLLAMLIEVGSSYPHLIGFFNRGADAAGGGSRFLLNSNLDWGQDLPFLADYARRNRLGKLRLSYFGADNPARYFEDSYLIRVAPPWSEQWAKGDRYVPAPGYYAISANLLPGHFFQPRYRDYYAAFRSMQPIHRAGTSILVYHVKP